MVSQTLIKNGRRFGSRFSNLMAATVMISGSLVAATPLFLTQTASAATNTQVVTESDVSRQLEDTAPTNNWVIYTRPATPGTATFQAGPATAPLGKGSLELKTVSGSDKVWVFNYDHIGTKLSDINALGYSTYRTAGTLQQDAALNMEVDFNGPNVVGGFTTLVFEPVYNTDQGAVVNDQWQTWDAFNGNWWSTKNIGGVCAFNCFVSWNDIVAANPDATILGGFGVNQGSGNPALISAVDALKIGANGNTTTYDFELFKTATDKDQCKNDGYKDVKDASGNGFKNQGQCVSYVNGRENHQDKNVITKLLSHLF